MRRNERLVELLLMLIDHKTTQTAASSLDGMHRQEATLSDDLQVLPRSRTRVTELNRRLRTQLNRRLRTRHLTRVSPFMQPACEWPAAVCWQGGRILVSC